MSIIVDSIRENGFIHPLCDDAADEIEKLEQDIDKSLRVIKVLEQQLESYKLDAERYRWLRHGDNDDHCISHILTIDEYYLFRGKLLDNIIDKHIQNEKEYYESLGVAYDESSR